MPVLKLHVFLKKKLVFYAFPGFQFPISIKKLSNKAYIPVQEIVQINAFITISIKNLSNKTYIPVQEIVQQIVCQSGTT